MKWWGNIFFRVEEHFKWNCMNWGIWSWTFAGILKYIVASPLPFKVPLRFLYLFMVVPTVGLILKLTERLVLCTISYSWLWLTSEVCEIWISKSLKHLLMHVSGHYFHVNSCVCWKWQNRHLSTQLDGFAPKTVKSEGKMLDRLYDRCVITVFEMSWILFM